MDDYGRRGGGRRGREDEFDFGGGGTLQRLDSIQDPGKRYALRECIGSGVCGDVYEAVDQQAGNKKVAVKIQKLTPETQSLIVEEYRVLRDFAGHPNIPDFYGIYRRRSGKKTEYDQVWLVMELCEGGPVMDLVRGLVSSDKKLREEHIAYILKEVVKAVVHLHENNVIHRDIRGSNILLTKEGEVKLIDFGLSRMIKGEMGKRKTCIGSPCWMAPEVVTSKSHPENGYGSRADVWAIGITAIELADGKPPFQDMHPTRALFQIVRNPPPGLYRPANWSQNFNDFITECLEKNPDNRPFMAEIMEHPFLSELPENDYPLTQELKSLVMDVSGKGRLDRKPEVIVRRGFLKVHQTAPPKPMFMEDLAALEHLTEEAILDELHERLKQGYFQSFIGDILLVLNPNEIQDIYGAHFHTKYQFKSRSDNAPHIYAVADSAFQDVLHHEEPQHILLAGESNSGKTTNMLHVVKHLMYLGKGLQEIGARVLKAIEVIHAFSNAATPLNPNSTRCILQIQTTFGITGKASGAIFMLYQLEKWRISTRDKNQSNFHIFYYFYDGLEASGKLRQYSLTAGRKYRYLRIGDKSSGNKRSFKVRNDPHGNAAKFDRLKEILGALEMEENMEAIWNTLAAILILGEVKFVEGSNREAEIDNIDVANKVADLLQVDAKKFSWSLINYCFIKKGSALRRRHTCEEAKEARDVLANTIYHRLVDSIVNNLNHKLSVSRTLFGDKFCISVLDLFGFECFAVNRIEQLFVNTMNEQLQCHYNQRVFVWEMQEQEEEEIPVQQLQFYDNREAIDQLMGKNNGLFHVIDDASRQVQDAQYITERIKQSARGIHVKSIGSHEFTVAHYTGKLIYEASEISEKNRDFVPPEMIETLRLSTSEAIKQMFVNQLTKSGNLTMVVDYPKSAERKTAKSKWGAALLQENTKQRKFNTASRGQFSQTRKMRTCSAIFRSTSLEILKNLSVGGGSGGTHFVRCIRADLESVPRGFHRDVVRQQIRALSVLDTAKARQRGFPHRIPFQEFLRRYKFLAFDFDENVELTKDNCRLLLVRLKMEGWVIGKTKVFLKYYNEEYLSRLYETQVKKIIKVQCMLRSFLARKSMATKITKMKKDIVKKASIKKKVSMEITEEDAAVKIQKVYRGYSIRKQMDPPMDEVPMDQETMNFMRSYSRKWRSKSMFQVLLRYRAARYQDLVHFSQQVHLFNQATMAGLQATNERVSLERIDPTVKASLYLGERRPQVHKLPFDMRQEFPYFDSSYMNDPTKMRATVSGSRSSLASDEEHEAWDAPLRRQTVPWGSTNVHTRDVEVQTTNSPHREVATPMTGEQSLINTPFSRDPNIPVRCPPEEVPRSNAAPGFQPPINFRSPAPPIAHSPQSKPGYDGNYNGTGSIRSRKKVPPPPIPFNKTPHTQGYNSYDSENRNKHSNSGYNDWEFEDKSNKNSANNNRVNPIHEMQMMGRKNNNEADDEPPFNFQVMLRKTQHNRASMKRTQIYDSYAPSPPPPMSGYRSSNRDDMYNTNVVYKSDAGPSRRDSPEWSPNEMVRMSEKYGRDGAWGRERENVLESSKSITTELAPGIIVEGYVAEL